MLKYRIIRLNQRYGTYEMQLDNLIEAFKNITKLKDNEIALFMNHYTANNFYNFPFERGADYWNYKGIDLLFTSKLYNEIILIKEKEKEMITDIGTKNIKISVKTGDNWSPLGFSSFSYSKTAENKLPKKYIINKKKKTTVLLWEDDTKTIVKVSKNDKYDKKLGFLTAYFQKHSGLSRNKANKYLDELEEE